MSVPHHHNEENERLQQLRKQLTEKGDFEQLKNLDRFESQLDGTAMRQYSDGRLGPKDEGDLAFLIGIDESGNNIQIEFGKEITGLIMNPASAVEVAQRLIRFARKTSKEPITVQLH